MLPIFTSEKGISHPSTFASWAMAKANELAQPRKRTLMLDKTVRWNTGEEENACSDHVELSGFFTSAILSYGKDQNGHLRLMRHVVVPSLRKKPNQTSSSLSCNFNRSSVKMFADGKELTEFPTYTEIRGLLRIVSSTESGLTVQRELFPAVHSVGLIEQVTVINNSNKSIKFTASPMPESFKLPKFRCVGSAIIAFSGSTAIDLFTQGSNTVPSSQEMKPGDEIRYTCVYSASQSKAPISFSVKEATKERETFTNEMFNSLKLESPNEILNAQFSHCVLRGSESIFETKNGLMHAPGGGNFYAALWTNDQCEYANPFFPYSGYQAGIEQSINCYSLYEAYMDRSSKPMIEKRALVTSIIAEGDGFWNGAKDRGDGEMYAYGLSRFLLGMGDIELMKRFYPNLQWCLDFALSRKTEDGVISSNSDELENRFPSGSANLFTSCVTYDAFENCALIAEILGHKEEADTWRKEKSMLKIAIEKFFGRKVEGFDTYRYYDGNEDLRAWICMPLSVEIFDRAKETVRALYSPKLFKNGMLKTTSTNETTWDRSLLFSLRGTLLAGMAKEGTDALLHYCQNRLLGTHAPYPFEAYPEGNRAHLAAESILFARVVTEGLFGLRPVGLKRLRIAPQLSGSLPWIALKGLCLFGLNFDLKIDEKGITITLDGKEYHSDKLNAVFDFNNCSFD